jgi:hypothetical protein
VNRNRAPRSERERVLRGRLLGQTVQLVDGRSGVLQSVWYEPVTRALSCCVSIGGASAWVDTSEIKLPDQQDGTRGPVA